LPVIEIISPVVPTELTSTTLDAYGAVLPRNVFLTGKIGTKKYLVVGDGATPAKNLPKLALAGVSKLSELEPDCIVPWETPTGPITIIS
jgi:hypothetical protein